MPWRREWLPTPIFLPGEFHWREEPGGLYTIERLTLSMESLSPSPLRLLNLLPKDIGSLCRNTKQKYRHRALEEKERVAIFLCQSRKRVYQGLLFISL